ncbi:hypothetical protein [Brevibacillus laterosporus]|uniref:hypothetical protein n=1 Tax=Brevibacillus laterosporus TaxID=1465 RepID=UPI003D1BBD30
MRKIAVVEFVVGLILSGCSGTSNNETEVNGVTKPVEAPSTPSVEKTLTSTEQIANEIGVFLLRKTSPRQTKRTKHHQKVIDLREKYSNLTFPISNN